MKRANIANFFTEAELDAAVAAAPETVPYDPDNPPTTEEDWAPDRVFVTYSREEFFNELARRRAAREAATKTAQAVQEKPQKPRAIKLRCACRLTCLRAGKPAVPAGKPAWCSVCRRPSKSWRPQGAPPPTVVIFRHCRQCLPAGG